MAVTLVATPFENRGDLLFKERDGPSAIPVGWAVANRDILCIRDSTAKKRSQESETNLEPALHETLPSMPAPFISGARFVQQAVVGRVNVVTHFAPSLLGIAGCQSRIDARVRLVCCRPAANGPPGQVLCL